LLEVPVHPQIHTAPVRSRMMKRYGFMYYIHVREREKSVGIREREETGKIRGMTGALDI